MKTIETTNSHQQRENTMKASSFRLIRSLFGIIAALAMVLGVSSYVAMTPRVAEAQTSTISSTISNISYSNSTTAQVNVVMGAGGSTDKITIAWGKTWGTNPAPTVSGGSLMLGTTSHTADIQTLTLDPNTGLVTFQLKSPITVASGDQLKLGIQWSANQLIPTNSANLSTVYVAGAATSTPTPTATPRAGTTSTTSGDPAPTAPVNGQCIPKNKMISTATPSTGLNTHSWVTLTRTIDDANKIERLDATVKDSTGFDVQGGADYAQNTVVTVYYPDGTSKVLKNAIVGKIATGLTQINDESGKSWGGVRVTGLNVDLPAGSKIEFKIPYRQTGTTAGTPILPGKIAINGVPIVLCPAIPTQCEVGVNKNINGITVPYMGDESNTQVAKLPPRELTQAEKDRGDVAYVTYSSPNQRHRYSSQLAYQPNAGSSFEKIGETTGWVVNALAYNSADNWLYAISQPRYGTTQAIAEKIDNTLQTVPQEDPCFPAGHLLQIDPVTGEVHNLGKVTGSGPDGYGFGGIYAHPWPNDLWGGINVGFFDKNDAYWVTNASISGTGVLYKVDLDSVSATTNNPTVAFGTDQWDRRMTGDWCSEGPTPTSRAEFNTLWDKGQTCTGGSEGRVSWRVTTEDFTIAPEGTGNYAWGIQNGWATADHGVYLERINLDNGQVQRFDITNLTNAYGEKIAPDLQWGKAWFYGNGNLAFGTASFGANSNVVQIKVTNPDDANPTFELISVDNTAPVSYNSNATSSVNPKDPRDVDLELKKDYVKTENGRANWWITVKNNGPDTSAGFVVKDEVPNPPYSDVKVPYVYLQIPGQAGFTTLVRDTDYTLSQSGNNISVNLRSTIAGATVYIAVNAAEASSYAGCIPNIATVIGLDSDPKPENNTAEDDRCSLTMEKTAVDVDGDGQITGADTSLPGPNGTKKISYTIQVRSPQGAPEMGYQIFDIPKFANLVNVKGAKVTDAKIISGTGSLPSGVVNRTFGAPVPAEGWPVVTTSDAAKIGANSVHQYTIEVYYTVVGDLNAPDAPKECTSLGAGNGLFNEAKMIPTVGLPVVDDGCGPIVAPREVMLTVIKVDHENKEQPLVGAEFSIYDADAQGNIIMDQGTVKVMADGYDPFDPSTKGYHTIALKPDTLYYLVETKSPMGYNLLAQPVMFKISRDASGNQVVTFFKSGEPNTPLPAPDALVQIDQTKEPSKSTAYVQVADVTQGQLPRTGGSGLLMPLAAAAIFIAAGFLYTRRRV